MNVYLDTSAVLRLMLDETGPSAPLAQAQTLATSILTETECRRTLDRLRRAGDPLPVPLGTLDALHLATARTLQETTGAAWTVATHDRAMARAARLTGLGVLEG